MSDFEIYDELNNGLSNLCDLFAEMNEESLSPLEKEEYEKRVQYYEKRFNHTV